MSPPGSGSEAGRQGATQVQHAHCPTLCRTAFADKRITQQELRACKPVLEPIWVSVRVVCACMAACKEVQATRAHNLVQAQPTTTNSVHMRRPAGGLHLHSLWRGAHSHRCRVPVLRATGAVGGRGGGRCEVGGGKAVTARLQSTHCTGRAP